MLICINPDTKERLNKALQFAHIIGKEHDLLANLWRMGYGWSQKEYVCFLYPDFVKHSFTFACYNLKDVDLSGDEFMIKRGKECWMNGGLIYHGPDLDGSREETFSVQLTEHDGWSIHT